MTLEVIKHPLLCHQRLTITITILACSIAFCTHRSNHHHPTAQPRANFDMETTTEFSLLDTIDEWVTAAFDLDARHPAEWAELDEQLGTTQYAYIKFGLLLERIRAKCAYKSAPVKLATFKDFCTQKIRLTVWQANSYIQAAQVAVYLAQAGFEILPKNYSQAAALIKLYNKDVGYYQERPALITAWENILAANTPTEITTYRINAQTDPDWAEKQSQKLSKVLLARAKHLAKQKGITVGEYLTELMNGDEEPGEIEVDTQVEQVQILDDLEREIIVLFERVSSRERMVISAIIEQLADRALGMLGVISDWMGRGIERSLY